MSLLESLFLLSIYLNVSVRNFCLVTTKFSMISLRMQTDYKTTKKHYPRTNNESVLEFVFEKDPNLFLRKNKIKIFGKVSFPDDCLVDTGFAAKLFSMLSVEINIEMLNFPLYLSLLFMAFATARSRKNFNLLSM